MASSVVTVKLNTEQMEYISKQFLDKIVILKSDKDVLIRAIEYTLAQMEYMRMLWGGEGVTDGIAQRLKDVLQATKDSENSQNAPG